MKSPIIRLLICAALACGLPAHATEVAGFSGSSFRLARTPAPFYVGFEKSLTTLQGIQPAAVQPQINRTIGFSSALSQQQLRALDAGRTTPAFTISHGFEQLQIGRVKKVEEFQTNSAQDVSVQATSDLFWGDTFLVRPSTANGHAIQTARVTVERSVSSTGDASSLAYYRSRSSTFVNGVEVPQLQYTLSKDPGGVEQGLGQAVVRYEFTADVGSRFTMEGLLSILDGLGPNLLSPGSEYIRNGSDGAVYLVSIQPGLGLCLRSASGLFTSGDCR